jgi:Flp pilus assembly pilin Flp/uncharacterized protein YnzC (UPF0291/DUF896 family)
MKIAKKERSPGNRGQSLTEYALILTLVAAAVILILVVVGVDIGDVFARINQAIGLTDNDLPPGTIEVTLLDNDGNGVEGSYIYAFDDKGNWLGLYKRTDSEGVATFEDMEDGAYQFLAYRSPHYYWSSTISFPRQNQTTIKMNVQEFTVTVLDENDKGVRNVYVYAYTANQRYWLGAYGRTGNDGKVVLDLPDGDYKFRAYTNGHYYWSDAVNSPAQNSTEIKVQDYEMTVTVVDDAGNGVKQNNLYVYAYTENGYYAGVYGRTNGNGRVKLEVPTGSYKFRVYYRASNYWSDVTSVPGTDETVIKTEERPYTVTVVDENGQPVKRTWVYAYSGNGYYIGLRGKTNNQGEITFDLPRANYKFRADYRGQSYWSSVISTDVGSSTTMTLK